MFASPDVNWDDVQRMLMGHGGASFMAPDGTMGTVDEKLRQIVFTGMVTVDVNVNHQLCHNVFRLHGPATVELNEDKVRRHVQAVRESCAASGCSEDPDTWILLPRSGRNIRIISMMDAIAEDPLLRTAYITGRYHAIELETTVIIQYVLG